VGTIELTAATIDETITGNNIVLIDWWAEWCGPCRRFAPIYEEAAARHDDAVFAKVDTEANQALAGAAGIMSIPTLMIFREGVLVFRESGPLPAEALDQLINRVRELDMKAVHQAVAERTDA